MGLDLRLTKSEEILKSTTLDFLQREIPKDTLEALLDSDTGYTESIWEKIVDIGWLGVIIPEAYGGIGYPLTTAGVLFETLGSWPLPGPYFSSGILGSLIVMEAGSEEQKKQLLPEIANGNIILTLALTEPAYSWAPEDVKTAVRSERDGFTLNGVKLFTPDAQAASHFIVVASSGEGISLLLVDREAPGVKVRELSGFLAGRTFEVKLDSVKVPPTALIGTIDGGWPALANAIDRSIPVLCAYKVGGCQAVFDMALAYSRERVQFSQPIGRFQRVQDMIIEMVNHTDAARWATYETLWKLDTRQTISESVHLAKSVASEAYWQVCNLGHRVFSGVSYSKEHALSYHTRTSRHLYNVLGDPAYHRQQIARKLLS